MARIDIDIDQEAAEAVMKRYLLGSTEKAVIFALRTLAADSIDVDRDLGLRGSGWEGDLESMRKPRIP